MDLPTVDHTSALPDYLGITEAAEYLRVSASTLRRWEKKGFLIPERTPTGIRRYTKQQLDAVLQQGPQYMAEDEYEAPPSSLSNTYDAPPASMPTTQQYGSTIPTSPIITSHRQAPPPLHEPENRFNTYVDTPPKAYEPQLSQQYRPPTPAISSFHFPEDDVQKTLNDLSHYSSDVHHEPIPQREYTAPSETSHFSPFVQSPARTSNESTPIPQYQPLQHQEEVEYTYAPPQQSNDAYETFDFESEYDASTAYYADEYAPAQEQTYDAQEQVVERPRHTSSSKKGGFAVFLGVFIGILILSAGAWLGYLYLTGGLGTASLLSPVP